MPRLIGDTVPAALPGREKSPSRPLPAKATAKPTGTATPQKPAPIKRKPEPEIVPPIAIVEETMIEEPMAEEALELPDLATVADEEPLENSAPRYIEAEAGGGCSLRPPAGRFEKTHETIYRGENLDLPTFRRRRLAIQL